MYILILNILYISCFSLADWYPGSTKGWQGVNVFSHSSITYFSLCYCSMLKIILCLGLDCFYLGVEDLGVEYLSLNRARRLDGASILSVDLLWLTFLIYDTTKFISLVYSSYHTICTTWKKFTLNPIWSLVGTSSSYLSTWQCFFFWRDITCLDSSHPLHNSASFYSLIPPIYTLSSWPPFLVSR